MSHAASRPAAMRSWPLHLALALVLPAALVAAMYLWPFVRDPQQLPFGADTYGYMWRGELVRQEGVTALTPERVGMRKTLGERPGHVVVLALLRTVSGTSALELMWVLPAAFAAVVAIAAAGLALETTEGGSAAAGLVGIGLAASAFIARTAEGYNANLMFDVLALTVAVLAIRIALGSERLGWVGAAALLGAGALFHWIFAVVFALLLAGFAILVAVGRAALRGPSRPASGASLRIVAIVIAAGALAFLAFQFGPELPGRLPRGGGTERRTDLRLPSFRLALTLPAAAVGAVLILLAGSIRRWSLGVLVPWASLAVVGLIGWYWLDLDTRPYRFAGAALGVPLLIVLGPLAIARLDGGVVRALGTIAAAGAAGALAITGAQVWWNLEPKHGPELFAQLAVVERYAERLPTDTVIGLTYGGGFRPISPVRAGLPVDLIGRTSLLKLRDRAPVVPRDGVLLHLEALNRRPAPSGGQRIAPGVTLVAGPDGAVPAPAPPRAPRPARLAAILLMLTGCLVVVGAGWTVALTQVSGVAALTAAPAFGLAGLGVLGTVASRLGVPLEGPGGVALIAGIAGVGWVAAVVRRHRGGLRAAKHLGGADDRRRASTEGATRSSHEP
jgi:hypothetical protein